LGETDLTATTSISVGVCIIQF